MIKKLLNDKNSPKFNPIYRSVENKEGGYTAEEVNTLLKETSDKTTTDYYSYLVSNFHDPINNEIEQIKTSYEDKVNQKAKEIEEIKTQVNEYTTLKQEYESFKKETNLTSWSNKLVGKVANGAERDVASLLDWNDESTIDSQLENVFKEKNYFAPMINKTPQDDGVKLGETKVTDLRSSRVHKSGVAI